MHKTPFVYLVTDRRNMDEERFVNTIVQAVQGGVKMVQLREKNATFEEFCAIGMRLHALLKPMNIPLIINDRIDVALAVQADGVHLGQSDAQISEARALLGDQAIIGLSLNKLDDLITTKDVDYIAASPVFSSRTKQDCGPPFGLTALKELCRLSPHPVVGIGGIHRGNIEDVLHCGVKGIAVISEIMDAPCPKSAAQALVRKMRAIE